MKFTVDFLKDFFLTFGRFLTEAIYITLSLINHIISIGIKGIIRFYNSIFVPTVQQTIEVLEHLTVTLYRDTLFFLSIVFMGLADFSIWISKISQQKAKEIQRKYRWL